MSFEITKNDYAAILREQGKYVISVDNTDWYSYEGFMLPAYLPHCTPKITEQTAQKVLKISRRPFVRWISDFGICGEESSRWWYVLKHGPWSIDSVSNKKKRWMIRQGLKNFSIRPMLFDEVVDNCSIVAELAATRYKGKAEVESREVLAERVKSAKSIPGVLEYIGCFRGDRLVGYSENYKQGNAVWLAIIRYNPEFLNEYSSYALINGVLDYYLNQHNFAYVLDGSRNIHHRTSFQEHLIDVFGFTREYALLHICYAAWFKMLINICYPSKSFLFSLSDKVCHSLLDNICAVLKQEEIRRFSCKG